MSRWASADEVVERYPMLTRDDVIGLAALGNLVWRSEPIFADGRLVATATMYDLDGVERVLADNAITELLVGARKHCKEA